MDAFDADVLIYAAIAGHALGGRVRALFDGGREGVGSVLLLPEVLSKPLRERAHEKVTGLAELLGRLDLRAVDRAIDVTYPEDLPE